MRLKRNYISNQQNVKPTSYERFVTIEEGEREGNKTIYTIKQNIKALSPFTPTR